MQDLSHKMPLSSFVTEEVCITSIDLDIWLSDGYSCVQWITREASNTCQPKIVRDWLSTLTVFCATSHQISSTFNFVVTLVLQSLQQPNPYNNAFKELQRKLLFAEEDCSSVIHNGLV